MRRLAGITIASFTTLALAGVVGSSQFDVGNGEPSPQFDATIIIEKELPDEYDADLLPDAWTFNVTSSNCGESISDGHGSGGVESREVEIDAEGGQSEEIDVRTAAFFGGGAQCGYRITEVPVDGWEVASPPGGVADVVPDRETRQIVTFTNRPVPPPEVTTTTSPDTTTTTEATTTTVADTTTTTEPEATTTAAPTTAPPTTAGTVAPELPATGSSNTLTGLLAGLLVLGGLGAVAISRRS